MSAATLTASAVRDVRTGGFKRTMAGLGAFGPAITHAGVGSRRAARPVLPLASALVVANGLQGFYLHLRGVHQKPGGFGNLRYNLEMGPPVFAPLLAALVGGMGILAALLRREGH